MFIGTYLGLGTCCLVALVVYYSSSETADCVRVVEVVEIGCSCGS